MKDKYPFGQVKESVGPVYVLKTLIYHNNQQLQMIEKMV